MFHESVFSTGYFLNMGLLIDGFIQVVHIFAHEIHVWEGVLFFPRFNDGLGWWRRVVCGSDPFHAVVIQEGLELSIFSLFTFQLCLNFLYFCFLFSDDGVELFRCSEAHEGTWEGGFSCSQLRLLFTVHREHWKSRELLPMEASALAWAAPYAVKLALVHQLHTRIHAPLTSSDAYDQAAATVLLTDALPTVATLAALAPLIDQNLLPALPLAWTQNLSIWTSIQLAESASFILLYRQRPAASACALATSAASLMSLVLTLSDLEGISFVLFTFPVGIHTGWVVVAVFVTLEATLALHGANPTLKLTHCMFSLFLSSFLGVCILVTRPRVGIVIAGVISWILLGVHDSSALRDAGALAHYLDGRPDGSKEGNLLVAIQETYRLVSGICGFGLCLGCACLGLWVVWLQTHVWQRYSVY